MTTTYPERLLTLPEAATRMGVSRRTLERLAEEGVLAVVRIRHSTRVEPAELERFIDENRSPRREL
jgi:excisionase family DNA binding protein